MSNNNVKQLADDFGKLTEKCTVCGRLYGIECCHEEGELPEVEWYVLNQGNKETKTTIQNNFRYWAKERMCPDCYRSQIEWDDWEVRTLFEDDFWMLSLHNYGSLFTMETKMFFGDYYEVALNPSFY
jgi:hypothetical protein